MRKISRINPFCERLATAWKEVPDWRFGQLMCNFVSGVGRDIFYMEDDKLINLLEKYCRNNSSYLDKLRYQEDSE